MRFSWQLFEKASRAVILKLSKRAKSFRGVTLWKQPWAKFLVRHKIETPNHSVYFLSNNNLFDI